MSDLDPSREPRVDTSDIKVQEKEKIRQLGKILGQNPDGTPIVQYPELDRIVGVTVHEGNLVVATTWRVWTRKSDGSWQVLLEL